jgi:hypothetical protein
MERLGIEPDGAWQHQFNGEIKFQKDWDCFIEDPMTYRQDKLALALPDWCFEHGRLMQTISFKYDLPDNINASEFDSYMGDVCMSRGQHQLKSTAKLIMLLEKGFLGKSQNKERE